MIISVHIPKTAGVAFRSFLEKLIPIERIHASRHVVESVVEGIPIGKDVAPSYRISTNVKAVHGHFRATAFDDIPGEFQKVVWMRHPVERVISHYYFWRNKWKADYGSAYRERVATGRSNLEEFSWKTRNLISIFLNGVRPEDFSFIGIVENFDVSLKAFCKEFNLPYSKADILNATAKKENPSVDLRKKIAEHNQEDMEIYNQSLDLVKRRYGLG